VKIPWNEIGLQANQKVLIGCSGGVDSMVLLKNASAFFCNLGAVYIHHGWRENSEKELELVRGVCESLGVSFHVERIPASHWVDFRGSWELEARKLRYEIFERIAEQFGYSNLLLAHHRDDVVETVLMNQMRGTGLSGMKGIPAFRGIYVRPMLSFSKEEILQFAEENGVKWMEDESNGDYRFLRNSVRHRLIPMMEAIQPQVRHSIARNAWFMGLQNELMNELVEGIIPTRPMSYGFQLDLDKVVELKNAPMGLFTVLRRYGFSWEQCGDVLAHINQKNIRWQSKNWQAVLVGKTLQLGQIPAPKVFYEGSIREWNEKFTPVFDSFFREDLQVTVRTWRAGDKMEYLPEKHKNVSDFLPSKGIYGLEKDGVLVVEWEGKLIAVGTLWVHADWRSQ
jgi:tRNA(Ile)-lysidine synthase